jgi:NADPH:quinone reductase-like Zn-dependent oxidoreductase
MLALIGEKRIKPVIERTFTLAEAREGLLHLQDKHRFGKVVIRI